MCVCAYVYFTDLVILNKKKSLENNVDNRNTTEFHECDLLNGAFFLFNCSNFLTQCRNILIAFCHIFKIACSQNHYA